VGQHYEAYKRWDGADSYYQNTLYKESCQSFSEIYKLLQFDGPYLQYYGKALYMNESYKKSLGLLEQAANLTSDEILYTTQGDTYKALKNYSRAEEAYQQASLMVPAMLYPKYLLANLYEETGENEKAVRVAEELLSQKVKVESAATDEITIAMQKLIKKLNTSAEDFEKKETQN
jgi:tetratricopeptide (TPR) repeat protein